MITKITKTQEKKIKVYLDKWLKAGYRTKTIDRKKATKAVHFMYEKIMKLEKPKYVIFLDSPMAVQLACNIIKGTKFDSQLRNQLRNQLYNQLGGQLGSQLDSQLDSQLRSQLRSQKLSYFDFTFSPWWWGGGIAYYGFYEYILDVVFPKKKKEFSLFKKYCEAMSELHYTFYTPELAIVSNFPKQINKNAVNQLHNPDGASMVYRDSWALYNINGISVPKELAITPANKLNAIDWLKNENVDIRREAFRKIGVAKVMKDLGAKVIDSYTCPVGGKYELVELDIGMGAPKPYLRMSNPSMDGVEHIEGVQGKSVKEALAFRQSRAIYIQPEQLT